MSDGFHFSDCASRKGAETCDCRYSGVEKEKNMQVIRRIAYFIVTNRIRFTAGETDSIAAYVISKLAKALSDGERK
jgi:hypothetical protein